MQDEDNVYRQGDNVDINVNPGLDSSSSSSQSFRNQDPVNPALPRESKPISDIQGSNAQQTKPINQFPLGVLSEQNKTTSTDTINNNSNLTNINDNILQNTTNNQNIVNTIDNKNDDSSTDFLKSTAVSEDHKAQENNTQELPVINTEKPKTKKGKAFKIIIITILILSALFGAAAAAYFGYIIPNNPENKLGSSLLNAFKNEQGTVSGKIDFKSKTGDNMAVAVDYKLQNTAEGSMSLSGNLGVQGTSFPFESIYADKDMYVKVGGLNAIASFLPTADTSGLDFSKLSDTWFVINRSLIQSSDQANCALDINTSLSKGDQSKLKKAYNSHPLFLVESSNSEKLDGQSVTKMVIKPTSDDEANKFAKELENLDVYKKAKECFGSSFDSLQSSIDEEINPDDTKDMKTTMIAYIGKGNQLKKVEIKGSDDESDVLIDMNFDWSPVTITKPEGAKPIQDIISALDMNSLSSEDNSGF